MALLGYNYDSSKDLYWKLKSQKVFFKWVWSKELEYIAKEDLLEKVMAYINYESYKPITFSESANLYEDKNEYLITDVTIYKNEEGFIRAKVNKLDSLTYNHNKCRYRINSFSTLTYDLKEEDLALFLNGYMKNGLLSRKTASFWESLTPLTETKHNT